MGKEMEGQEGPSIEVYLFLKAVNKVSLFAECSDGSKPTER